MALMLYIIPVVSAGDIFPIDTINNCYGDIKVEVQTSYDNYTLQGCIPPGDRFWVCPCSNPNELEISLQGKTKDQFDFIIWYDVEDVGNNATQIEKDNAARKRELSDMVFEKKIPIEPGMIIGPMMIIVGVLFVIFIFIFIGGYFIYKWIKDDDEPSDEDIDKFLEELARE